MVAVRAQVSRDAPPPLPGGYKVGEKVFYTWSSCTLSNGDKLVHGQQGEVTGPTRSSRISQSGEKWVLGQQAEVTGPATSKDAKRVAVRFPGNEDYISCQLTSVRRLHAASAATPHLPPTNATLPTPRVRSCDSQPLLQRPSLTA